MKNRRVEEFQDIGAELGEFSNAQPRSALARAFEMLDSCSEVEELLSDRDMRQPKGRDWI